MENIELNNKIQLIENDIFLCLSKNQVSVDVRDIHSYIYTMKKNMPKKYKLIIFEQVIIGNGYVPVIHNYSKDVEDVIIELIKRNILTIVNFDRVKLTKLGNFMLNDVIIEVKEENKKKMKNEKDVPMTVGEMWKLMIDKLSGMGNMLWENKTVDNILGEFTERVMHEADDLVRYCIKIEDEEK